MEQLFKYPRTRHLEGSRKQAGDEDLACVGFGEIEGKYLVLEEKVDGANCGISFNSDKKMLLQSRGHYLTAGTGNVSLTYLNFGQDVLNHSFIYCFLTVIYCTGNGCTQNTRFFMTGSPTILWSLIFMTGRRKNFSPQKNAGISLKIPRLSTPCACLPRDILKVWTRLRGLLETVFLYRKTGKKISFHNVKRGTRNRSLRWRKPTLAG